MLIVLPCRPGVVLLVSYNNILWYFLFAQLFTELEEDSTGGVSRPEFPGQCLHGHNSP